MKTWVWMAMIAAVIASAAILYVYVLKDDSEGGSEENLQGDLERKQAKYSVEEHDYSKAPPEAIFNSEDSKECRQNVG